MTNVHDTFVVFPREGYPVSQGGSSVLGRVRHPREGPEEQGLLNKINLTSRWTTNIFIMALSKTNI